MIEYVSQYTHNRPVTDADAGANTTSYAAVMARIQAKGNALNAKTQAGNAAIHARQLAQSQARRVARSQAQALKTTSPQKGVQHHATITAAVQAASNPNGTQG